MEKFKIIYAKNQYLILEIDASSLEEAETLAEEIVMDGREEDFSEPQEADQMQIGDDWELV